MTNVQEVLIAESSEAFSAELCSNFQKEYRVTCCYDGLEALKLLKVHTFDILILDLMLPRVDGITILKNLNSNRPLIILAVTTMTNSYIELSLHDLGVSYLMMRPCRADVLMRRTENIIRNSEIIQIQDNRMLSGRF